MINLNAPIEEGAILYFDSATMTCKNDAEANRMFTRNHRTPFVVPKLA